MDTRQFSVLLGMFRRVNSGAELALCGIRAEAAGTNMEGSIRAHVQNGLAVVKFVEASIDLAELIIGSSIPGEDGNEFPF
jgi:hypothetical protein